MSDKQHLQDALVSPAQPVMESGYERAHALLAAGHHSEAVAMLEAIAASESGHARARNDLGVLYYQEMVKSKDQALAHFAAAIELDPSNSTSYKNLADVLVETGRTKDAAAVLVQLLSQHLGDREAWASLCKLDEERFSNCLSAARGELARRLLSSTVKDAGSLRTQVVLPLSLFWERQLRVNRACSAVERTALEQLRQQIGRGGDDPRPYWAAMLFQRPELVGWPENLWQLPSPLATEYLSFLLSTPGCLNDTAEFQRYVEVLSKLVSFVHSKVVTDGASSPRHDLAEVLLDKLPVIPFYPASLPKAGTLRQRAEIIERLVVDYRRKPVCWRSEQAGVAGKIRLGILCADLGERFESRVFAATCARLPRERADIFLFAGQALGSDLERDCKTRVQFVLLPASDEQKVQFLRAHNLDVLLRCARIGTRCNIQSESGGECVAPFHLELLLPEPEHPSTDCSMYGAAICSAIDELLGIQVPTVATEGPAGCNAETAVAAVAAPGHNAPGLARIRCDVFYSPTHKELMDRFLEPTCGPAGIDLVRIPDRMIFPAHEWDSPGMMEFCLATLHQLAYGTLCTDQLRMVAGADYVYLRPFADWAHRFMQDYDIAFADDAGLYCQDFCLYWDTMAARRFFYAKSWLVYCAAVERTKPGSQKLAWVNDQHVVSALIREGRFGNLRIGFIPSNIVSNYPACTHQTEHYWQPGMEFDLFDDTHAFHGNWTVGVPNKIALLTYVAKKYNCRWIDSNAQRQEKP